MASPLVLHGHLKPAPPRKKLSDVSLKNIVVGHRRHVLVMPCVGDHVSVERYSTGSHIFGLSGRRQRVLPPCNSVKQNGEQKLEDFVYGNTERRNTRCVFYCILCFLKWKKKKKRRKRKSNEKQGSREIRRVRGSLWVLLDRQRFVIWLPTYWWLLFPTFSWCFVLS